MTVKEVKERELPEEDEELAKDLGARDLKDLNEKIEKDLEVEEEERVRPIDVLLVVIQEPPEAERLQPVEPHLRRKFRVGRTADGVHFVPHTRQFPTQVMQIDPLTAGVHIPLVEQKTDLHDAGSSSARPTGACRRSESRIIG